MDTITFEDFAKLEIRIGRVVSAEKVAGADKLLKLEVDFGSAEQNSSARQNTSAEQNLPGRRQIVSGIAEFYTPEELVGKQIPFVVNLEPRTVRGLESQGMIMAVDVDGKCVLLSPDKEVPEGSIIK